MYIIDYSTDLPCDLFFTSYLFCFPLLIIIIRYEIYQYRFLLYVEHSLFNRLPLQLIFHILYILLPNVKYIINYLISVRTLYAVYIFSHMLEGEISSPHVYSVKADKGVCTSNKTCLSVYPVMNYICLFVHSGAILERI